MARLNTELQGFNPGFEQLKLHLRRARSRSASAASSLHR